MLQGVRGLSQLPVGNARQRPGAGFGYRGVNDDAQCFFTQLKRGA